ncbi:hydroxyacylglutathione hydrolase [Thiocystis violascens]|uniref:Hydroxyacylglutathione hydrolase n=1 Tax=Thiocystis violascens (strain ATCC 17096 / DSM 198 / 6111) TaxID=765911 RepID=I3Y988_THIV6|nr:hydroxyacylglutathione hydrolase [Thiocystis violascens]AFL73556.1 hydroxyacylglutathione hydrolase [Thiocystis violascens DSM 198]
MLQVRPIHAFSDNYIWLLTEGSGSAVVVDPGDADPVLETLAAEHLTLTSVLVTHHHQDHIGGLDELLAAFPEARIYGPDDRRIHALTDRVGEGDACQPAGLNAGFRVMDVPGHTATHIAYLGAGRLFCGDTLFAAGCGRVFDGTFEQLAHSLERIAALPGDTLCYCAHEYTLANLGFARWVEPDSAALANRLRVDHQRRKTGQPTVPSRLDLELATNPFLRTGEPGVIAVAEAFAGRALDSRAEVFTALRRWKDERYD